LLLTPKILPPFNKILEKGYDDSTHKVANTQVLIEYDFIFLISPAGTLIL